MARFLLLALALLTWGATVFAFLSLYAAVDGSAIREIEALLVGGFGLLTGSVFLTGAVLAPEPKKRAPEWGDR